MPDDLQDIKGIGRKTADKLMDGGYKTFESLAASPPSTIAEECNVGESTAQKAVQGAKERVDMGMKTGLEIAEEREARGKLSTRIPELDDILEGGFPAQTIVEFFGDFSSGKTQFAHYLTVLVQLPEEYGGFSGRAIYLDTEDSFRPSRVEDMIRGLDDEVLLALAERDLEEEYDVEDEEEREELVEDLTEIILDRTMVSKVQNSNHQKLMGEKAIELVQEYKEDEFPVKLVVVDSLIAHFRTEYVGRGQLSNRQGKIKAHMSDLNRITNLSGGIVFFTNQVMDDPDTHFGDPKKSVGGNVLAHPSTYRLKIRESKDDKRVIKIVDAPDLGDKQAAIRITDNGIEPED